MNQAAASFGARVLVPTLALVLLILGACDTGAPRSPAPDVQANQVDFALAIHGGAGTIPESLSEERKKNYVDAISAALQAGIDALASGRTSLDTVELVIRRLEDDPLFNAGKGAVFNHEGGHELDASIMDGSTLGCGAVAAVRTVKNPISLARMVMENTPHVFLAADGAERFADEMNVERVDQQYFFTRRRHESWRKALEQEREAEQVHGTVGAVALDRHGNLAAATSTGGLTNKRFGRVGDVPVIGAGTYANNSGCAVSCTGKGEEFIRNAVAHQVSLLVERTGSSVHQAATEVLETRLQQGDGGLIAVDRSGRIAMMFNTQAMPRGAADSSGRFEVLIW